MSPVADLTPKFIWLARPFSESKMLIGVFAETWNRCRSCKMFRVKTVSLLWNPFASAYERKTKRWDALRRWPLFVALAFDGAANVANRDVQEAVSGCVRWLNFWCFPTSHNKKGRFKRFRVKTVYCETLLSRPNLKKLQYKPEKLQSKPKKLQSKPEKASIQTWKASIQTWKASIQTRKTSIQT